MAGFTLAGVLVWGVFEVVFGGPGPLEQARQQRARDDAACARVVDLEARLVCHHQAFRDYRARTR